MKSVLIPLAALLTLSGAARADGFDEGGAKRRLEAAGYGDIDGLHEGNLGEWMAQATRDGRHVMVVLHPDGSVALRQQVDTPPVPPPPVPVMPAKP